MQRTDISVHFRLLNICYTNSVITYIADSLASLIIQTIIIARQKCISTDCLLKI